METNNCQITLSKYKVEKIAVETIRVLKNRFEKIPTGQDSLRNMPFHMAFLKAFYGKISVKSDEEALKFLTLSSWFHGLSTTLGQSYFESVAHILSDGEKRSFSDYKIPKGVATVIEEIISDLKNGKRTPNLQEEIKLIKDALNKNGELTDGLNFTADVYIEDSSKVIMIELKSVRPNSGEMRGEKQKILYGIAHLITESKKSKKNKSVLFYLGFPFDPTEDRDNPCGYDKERFSQSLVEFSKFFDKDSFLIASELWDFLSGTPNTMCQLLHIINSIARPDFEKKFNYVNKFSFIREEELYNDRAVDIEKFKEYISILRTWHLYSEIKLAGIVAKIAMGRIPLKKKEKKKFERLIHTSMFKHDGSGIKYNYNRKEGVLSIYYDNATSYYKMR